MSEFMGQASTITNLRDVFALEAMKIILASDPTSTCSLVAAEAYDFADKMIEARSQNGNP